MTTPTDEDVDTTESTVEPEESIEDTRRPRALTIVLALVIVVLLALSGFLGWKFLERRQADSARAAAVDAGTRYATDLASYDFTNLAGNFTTVTANSTEKFAQQYKQVSDNLTQLIVQMKATSKGSVTQLGVVESDADSAVLILFLDQAITNTNSPQPRVDRNRMRLSLVQSGDRWLIDDVQLL
ncbi:Mce-associated membrane protein [Actinokineospora alba]|uniref:Mce-associated membrane protein n=1 Tax=Actinokineospora alba TaxID=504798 RepID=A0A1H0GA31_9PSEU|nr:VirB8/TrbF family protein [Actinokineospora alba]TDP69820.1 Mce-associated membrane protein [Actinokineospora alba]SDI07934.1 Mce-associated membrane protein [Actinokineospora alba]SDO03701.1 Mce-associated membrane protein [Actinokineospora alba]